MGGEPRLPNGSDNQVTNRFPRPFPLELIWLLMVNMNIQVTFLVLAGFLYSP